MHDLVDMVPDPSAELLAAAVLARAARHVAVGLLLERAQLRAIADLECELRPEVIGLVSSACGILVLEAMSRGEIEGSGIAARAVADASRAMYARATRVGKGQA